jgi:hypothetical protein
MKKILATGYLLMAVAVTLAACKPSAIGYGQAATPPDPDTNWRDMGHGVKRLVDEQNNVICYVKSNGGSSSSDTISCVQSTIFKAQL